MCDPISATLAVVGASTAYSGMQGQKTAKKAARQQAEYQDQQAAAAEQATNEANAQAAADKAEADRLATEKRQNIDGAVNNINSQFSGYNDDYYKGVSDRYSNYYMPQLQDQYTNAQKEITYQLARQGILNSSARDSSFNEAKGTYDAGVAKVGNAAVDAGNKARQDVEGTKTSLVGQAQSGEGLENIGNRIVSETGRINGINQAPTFDALGNAFDSLLGGLGNTASVRMGGAAPTAGGAQLFNQGKKKNTAINEVA